jgi:hypothetical protein
MAYLDLTSNIRKLMCIVDSKRNVAVKKQSEILYAPIVVEGVSEQEIRRGYIATNE